MSLGKPDASGKYQLDAREDPFSAEELERALSLRQSARPDPRLKRKDQCPHTPMCADVHICIENIAWFLRYAHELNAPERARVEETRASLRKSA